MCRDNNFSHFFQIIFLNSLQAPNKQQALFQSPAEQTPCVSPLATFAFRLFIPQIMEQKKPLAARDKYSNPHIFIVNYPTYFLIDVSQGPTSPSVSIFQHGGLTPCIIIDLSSLIPLISVSTWTKGCLSLPSRTPGTMHTMRGSSEPHLSSFYRQPSTSSTYHGLKSTNTIVQYFYSLTQSTRF